MLRRRNLYIDDKKENPDNLATITETNINFNTLEKRINFFLHLNSKPLFKNHLYHIKFHVYINLEAGQKGNIYITSKYLMNSPFSNNGSLYRISWKNTPYVKDADINLVSLCTKNWTEYNGNDARYDLFFIDSYGYKGCIEITDLEIWPADNDNLAVVQESGPIRFDNIDSRKILPSNIIMKPATKGTTYQFYGKVKVNCEKLSDSGWDLRLWTYLRFQYVLRKEHNKKLGETDFEINDALDCKSTFNDNFAPFGIDTQCLVGTVEITNIYIYEVK